MKVKLNSKGKLMKIAEGKLKYHMSQNAMVDTFSKSYEGFSKGSVNFVCKLIDSNKWSLDDVNKMPIEEADEYLRPKQSVTKLKKDIPDFEDIHKKLVNEKRVTLFFLWRKYFEVSKDAYSYSRYCELYCKWCNKNNKAPVLLMNEVPGENTFVDWFGDQLDFCFDGVNKETVHFFCSTIGLSGYPYVEGFLDEKIPSYIMGHIHAFEYYGGLSKYVVCDNTKAAVTKNYQNDVVLNKVYEDMQEHYGYVVLPARPKSPTDKSDVEGTIGWLSRQLLMEIKDKSYTSLKELNADVLRIVKELSDLPYQKKNGTRSQWFNLYDKPVLKPLPTARFEIYDYALAKVPDNYHVCLPHDKNHYYSVPYKLINQSVIIKYSFSTVLILDMNSNVVAKHERSYCKYTYYTTVDEHMPVNHQIAKDIKTKDSNWYLSMAKIIGVHVEKVIQSILLSKNHPEQAYRSCMGIIAYHISHTYTDKDIELVCKEACELNVMTYSYVSRRLKEINKKVETHENLRGADDFK